MAAKKKTTKKAAKKAAKKAVKAKAKKTAKKAAKKTAKKVAKAAKKAPAKKAAKKTAKAAKKVAKKAVKAAKKAPAKKAAKAAPAKKAAAKKAPAKKAAKKAAKKKEEVPMPPPVKKLPKKKVKMTVFIQKQQQRLLNLRDQLMDAMYGVQQETLRNGPEGSEASGAGLHQGDAGSDAYDRDFALNLLSKEQDALMEIEAALERINTGYYGYCELSGKKIPQARLEAIPFARLTVECQSRWEQENPHRQFRTSDAMALGYAYNNGTVAVSLDAGA